MKIVKFLLRSTLLFALMYLVSTGCADFDRRTQFSATYTNRVVLGPFNTEIGETHEVQSDTLNTDFIQTLDNHSSKENKVESIRLQSISLEIDKNKSRGSANFNVLSDVEVYLMGKGMDEVLIGTSDSVPQGAQYFEIKVVPEGKDFEDIVKTEEFQCRIKYNTKKQITDTTMVIKITPTYLIDTKKFGI